MSDDVTKALAKLEADVDQITKPLSPSWMAGGIRHLNRNVDYEAFWSQDDQDSGDGDAPDRYEGKHMARVLNAAPALLAIARAAAELMQAMRDYEMEQEVDPPFKHREMMRRANSALAALAAAVQGEA